MDKDKESRIRAAIEAAESCFPNEWVARLSYEEPVRKKPRAGGRTYTRIAAKRGMRAGGKFS